jgi:predicted RND superfamily exporter protein
MWTALGKFILRFRLPLLLLLLAVTAFMAYEASKVQMSYEFSKAIPVDNPKYVDYIKFKQRFGDDGNTMVLGIQSKDFFSIKNFNAVADLQQQLKKITGVEGILGVPAAVNLKRNDSVEKLQALKIFHAPYTQQNLLDSDAKTFHNLPFYNGLLYNPDSNSYVIGLQLNNALINSKARTQLVNNILQPLQSFEKNTGTKVHISGLPFIRTTMAERISKEMVWFLIGSFILSAITLFIFFRSFSATIMSLLVVAMGVAWSFATMVLCGYKITLLTALIPPLIVVIGVPNCIYFLNKYHTSFRETKDKNKAIVTMVSRMGIVTLFCNIAAAIGFAVFALTQSALLKEFGVVAGINIMALFIISLIFIPAVLSYLPPPKDRHVRYLDNKLLENILAGIERWAFNYSKWIYAVTIVIIAVSIMGMMRLKSEGFIVDDLPKNDKIYTDLKWFESNFNGVMPLDIEVDTKKKNGLFKSLEPLQNIDEFSQYIASKPENARPLSLAEGMKFAKQSFYDGDSTNYSLPTEFDIPLMGKFLKSQNNKTAKQQNVKTSDETFSKLLNSFMDSTKQIARISVNMKDIGSVKLPLLLNDYQKQATKIFDTAHYKITFTGSSVTFLEGTSFIIAGLKQSIMYAFILIALCMLYLFRSFRILLCSLIPNIIPLLVTAGLMGWIGISLKPSTVLIFSVALGIAIDVTIRFLVNYKQELPAHNSDVKSTLEQTIRHTGLSIIYTSLVLIAGFVIFCFSSFGGTKALGWLTSLTLITGAITNLVLLPVLIYSLRKRKS